MKKIFILCFAVLAFASCATSTRHYGETGAVVNFQPSDFEFTGTKTAEATVVRVFGIDWESLFSKKEGHIGSAAMPATTMPLSDKTANKAAYQLISENPGYDVLFYPTVKTEKMSYIIYSTTKATVSGKLGRFKK